MPATLLSGPLIWDAEQDDEGYRNYKVSFRVIVDSIIDGPGIAMTCAGLPRFGDVYALGNELDAWAYCKRGFKATRAQGIKDGEPCLHYDIGYIFTTKPIQSSSCQQEQVQNPLLQPPKVSGSFVKYKEEATVDRFGNNIRNSSHEQIRGATVEFDASNPTVDIDMNVPILDIRLLAALIDCVNETPLWDQSSRFVKLSTIRWRKLYYGLCFAYYNLQLGFEINQQGFDRDILDEGTKVIHGEWDEDSGDWTTVQIAGADPDPNNPAHFDRYLDRQGNPCKVILNGGGFPAARNAPGARYLFTWTGPAEASAVLGSPPPGSNTAGIEVPSGLTGQIILQPESNVGAVIIFTVTAVSDAGETTVSNMDSFDVFSGAEVLLNWLAVSGAKQYKIYIEFISDTTGNHYGPGLWDTIGGDNDVTPGSIFVSKYPEVDFLTLGIPTTL